MALVAVLWRWDIAVETAAGGSETVEARALVSACGFFNKTHTPDFKGRELFGGMRKNVTSAEEGAVTWL